MKQFISYAQNQEDAVLDAYFKDVKSGFYVDIGANDPTKDSVTKSFYDRGWSGINVEPNPDLLDLINKERPRDINIQAGVADQNGEMNLRVYPNSGLSTISENMQKQYKTQNSENTQKYSDISVPVITLKTLLDNHKPKHIHFMKIDVEGMEYEVLKGNDWERYRPEVLCIEANHHIKNWKPILEKNNYKHIWNDGLNDYFLAKELSKRAQNFSYAEDMLVNRQVIAYHVVDKINSLIEEAEHGKAEVLALRLKVERLEEDNKLLQKEVLKERRLRYAFKNLVLGIDNVIIAQIERLGGVQSKTSVKGYKPADYDISSAQSLLSSIKAADLKSFYSQKKATKPKKHITYKIVSQIYFIPRHLAALTVRALFATRKQRPVK